jgi:hypothetical protein
MEVLQKYAHRVSAVQGPRILWMLSNVGCIVPNDYAVGAEMSLKLAKQVCKCVHCISLERYFGTAHTVLARWVVRRPCQVLCQLRDMHWN